MIQLILGGARSGKSKFAEKQAQLSGKNLFYIATAQAQDDEMQSRIAHHQSLRGAQWQLLEEPIELAQALFKCNGKNNAVVVDCLTLWLSNCLHETCYAEQQQALQNCLKRIQSDVFLVSNEVGSGIVPLGQLSRAFVDYAGRLHQDLAHISQKVSLIVAGLELPLKAS